MSYVSDKQRVKRRLAEHLYDGLMSGLSVEDLVDALTMAVNRRLQLARNEPSAAYRNELRLFYVATMRVLSQARGGIDRAGRAARKATR
jgi:hypothetical protein